MLVKVLTIILTPIAKALSALLITGIKHAIANRDIEELREEKQKLIHVHRKLTENNGNVTRKTAQELANTLASIHHKL